MHRNRDFGLDAPSRFGGFGRRHHVSPAHGEQGDIDARSLVHLRDHVRIAGVVNRAPLDVQQISHPSRRLWMKWLAVATQLVGVVRRNPGDVQSWQLDRLAWRDRDRRTAELLRNRRRRDQLSALLGEATDVLG